MTFDSLVRAAMAGLAMCTVGCASVDVTSVTKPTTDLAAYATWDYSSGDRVPDLPIVSVVQVEVGKALTARGYERSSDDPDLLIFVHPQTAESARTEHYRWGFYDEPGATDWWWDGGGVAIRDITIGAVMVDLVDRQAEELVWRGYAEGMIREQADVESRIARVQDAVATMLRQFPTARP